MASFWINLILAICILILIVIDLIIEKKDNDRL